MISEKNIDEITPESYSTHSSKNDFLDSLYNNSTNIISCDIGLGNSVINIAQLMKCHKSGSQKLYSIIKKQNINFGKIL